MKSGKELEVLKRAINTALYDPFVIHIAAETFVVADPDELHQIHTLWVVKRAQKKKEEGR